MDREVNFGPFQKTLSGADPIQARRFAAAKALEIEWGGVSRVSAITGFSRNTINKDIQELESNDELKRSERLRRPDGGRKRAADREPSLASDLEAIMDESTAGDPISLLKWTYKSTYAIAEELRLKGHKVSHDTVRRLLKECGYSFQANRKTLEGKSGPERDTQFSYINSQAAMFIDADDPVISVDAKKKLVGNYRNSGKPGGKKDSWNRLMYTISLQTQLVQQFPMESMTLEGKMRSLISENTIIFRNSMLKASENGGIWLEDIIMQAVKICSFALMGAEAMEAVTGDGSSFCRDWQMKLK